MLKRHPMSIQNVRRYFSNPRSLTPRHSRMSSDNHGLLSSISTSASLSPLKHSSLHLPYEEGTITKDFLGCNQSASLVVRRRPSLPFIHTTKPLCFSSAHEPDSKKWTLNLAVILSVLVSRNSYHRSAVCHLCITLIYWCAHMKHNWPPTLY